MEYKDPPTRRYNKGDVIFSEGDPGDEAFILRSGSIEVSVGTGKDRKSLDVITANQMFGEMSVIGNVPRTATAQCLEDTLVTVVDRKLVQIKIAEMDPYIRYLMQSLIDRLTRTSKRVARSRPQGLLEIPKD
ncbi:cyclic nucleotide-binding domain-containing protein [Nisaea sp.]|uniref:Crp/Fnr family transcriptional regulator n=1 Tax=Nisaea sp. TaxID=2024842 RepID=UPI003265AA17